jgi:predicted DNA-binding transcriptional regulator AlpA
MSKPKKAALPSKAALPKADDVPQFGTSNIPPANAQVPLERGLIVPRELPLMGIHYSVNHLRRMWNSGKFPKPTYTSERRFGWPPEELDRWMKEKIANHTSVRGVKA